MNKTHLATAIAVLTSGTLLAAVATGAFGLGGSGKTGHGQAPAAAGSNAAAPSSVGGEARPAKPEPLVKLEFTAPKYKKDLPLGLTYSSGWPLTIRAVATSAALGIATNRAPSQFPAIGQTGYVIFNDPDSCLELPAPFFRGPIGATCSDAPSDETYLEFTPDVDLVGVADQVDTGNPGRGAALGDPAVSGEPVFNGLSLSMAPESTAVGTPTGGAVLDGVGYGADDDLPGLVLLSPTGTGLVLDANFNPPYVRQQRNLAGFLNTVSYELRDATGSTVVHAGMVVPQSLFAPLLQIDDCVGPYETFRCTDPSRYRVDGGSVQTITTNLPYAGIFNARQYELRAFLVSGVAPSVLIDMNGDGVVTSADASLAGFTVISNEETVRFRQFHGEFCGGVPYLNTIYIDADGNGRAHVPPVCPGGPGQVSKIPD